MDRKEADFLIFDPQFGIMVIEVKSGNIKYKNGYWYQNEKPCTDPYDQACEFMYSLRRLVKKKFLGEMIPVIAIVWFPSFILSASERKSLPPDMEEFTVLDGKDANCPPNQLRQRIEQIFQQWQLRSGYVLKANPGISDRVKNVLIPELNLVQSLNPKKEEDSYFRLTSEQSKVLDFIHDEDRVAIGGSAGSGKTLVAFEQAKRYAAEGFKTLFMVFNKALRLSLSANTNIANLEISHWGSFIYKYAKNSNTEERTQAFLGKIESGNLKLAYDVLIIDEGQDFEQDWIAALELSLSNQSRIYVYYDNKQTIQNNKTIPDWIKNSQVRLNLNRNCRNTLEIATTAHAFVDAKARMFSEIHGPKPVWIQTEEIIEDLRKFLVAKTAEYSMHEIAIISLLGDFESMATKTGLKNFGKNKGISIFQDVSENPREEEKVIISTVRKFKGLEADVVIITDLKLSDKILTEEEMLDLKKRIYTACSRAKKELYIISETNKNSIYWNNSFYPKAEFSKYFKEQYHLS